MDKDLSLFEMIDAGDFSTVGGSKGAQAQPPANPPAQAQTFDFDAFGAKPTPA